MHVVRDYLTPKFRVVENGRMFLEYKQRPKVTSLPFALPSKRRFTDNGKEVKIQVNKSRVSCTHFTSQTT